MHEWFQTGAWREQLLSHGRKVKRFTDRHIRLFTWVTACLTVPLAVLFLIPPVLGLIAPPLGNGADFVHAEGPATFTFLDTEGNILGHRGGVQGQQLKLDQMPPYLPAAFIAMEDRRFYSHSGIDLPGLARATWLDLRAGRYVAGGSGISQQTAKILYGDRRRSLGRKLEELVNAARLEHSLGKQEILTLYLNRLYLGDGAYGVDAAARNYFGVSAQHVSLPQAAMLAALTRAPSVFSPRRDLPAARQRAALVLTAMVQTGAISEAQAVAAAQALPTAIMGRPHEARGYFLDAAADRARDLTEGRTGDFVVHTTLEPAVQQAAEQTAAATIVKAQAKLHVSQAAVVVLRPDGALSALVGGVDYERSEFDRALQAHRQPGSAFKPFVYLAALQAGITPWDWRDDQPVNIAGYQPSNYKNQSFGRLRLTDALARSVNTITVNLAQEVGIANVSAAARSLGITSPLQNNASLALGTNEVTPLELTAAYGAFANGGNVVTPYLVSSIQTAANGDVLYRHPQAAGAPVITAQQLRDMAAMLFNVVRTGTGTAARLGTREAAGKTGTTQDYRDAWFVGFTSDYVAGVWVGNDDDSPMRHVTGGTLPAEIWKSVMLVAEQGHPLLPLDRSAPPVDMDQPAELAAQATYVDEATADVPRAEPSDGDASVLVGSGVASPAARRATATPIAPPQDSGFERYERTQPPPRIFDDQPSARADRANENSYAPPPAPEPWNDARVTRPAAPRPYDDSYDRPPAYRQAPPADDRSSDRPYEQRTYEREPLPYERRAPSAYDRPPDNYPPPRTYAPYDRPAREAFPDW